MHIHSTEATNDEKKGRIAKQNEAIKRYIQFLSLMGKTDRTLWIVIITRLKSNAYFSAYSSKFRTASFSNSHPKWFNTDIRIQRLQQVKDSCHICNNLFVRRKMRISLTHKFQFIYILYFSLSSAKTCFHLRWERERQRTLNIIECKNVNDANKKYSMESDWRSSNSARRIISVACGKQQTGHFVLLAVNFFYNYKYSCLHVYCACFAGMECECVWSWFRRPENTLCVFKFNIRKMETNSPE